MAGANYMGGKRNAVKSKLRDATSRAQQGFFGRRRFELLSKGLAPSSSNTDANGCKKRVEISLAHARNKHPQRPINAHIRTPKTSPVQAQPTRDLCSKRPETERQIHVTSDISLCSLRKRVLSVPDLAGLKRGDTAPRRPFNIVGAARSSQGTSPAKPSRISYARQSTPSFSFSMSPDTGSAQPRPRWTSPGSRVDQPISRESPSDDIGLQNFPSDLSPLLSSFSSFDRTDKRGRGGESSPFRYVPFNLSRHGTNKTVSPSCSPIAFPEDGEEEIWDISTPSGGFGLEDLSYPQDQSEPDTKVYRSEDSFLAYSDLGSPFRFTSPPDYNVCRASSPNPELRSGNHRSRLLESDAAHSQSLTNDTSPITWLQTPKSSVTTSPHHDCGQSLQLDNDSPSRLGGCIFDYEDPWEAIGFIMGLSPNNPNKVSLEEELAAFGADEFGCGTAVSDDAGCNNALEGYWDEKTSSTMFSPARSLVYTTQERSGSSCISHCNNKAQPRGTCGSPELTDLADVSTGHLSDGVYMACELPACLDETDPDLALTCHGTRSRSCTISPVIAPSPHWPLSPSRTFPDNDNDLPLLSYDRQSEHSLNKDLVANDQSEPDSVTIVPSPNRSSTINTTRHQSPLLGDDGGQVDSHSDNNIGIELPLTLARASSSVQAVQDLNSHTIKGCFHGLRLFRDDSDAEST